MKNPYNPVTEPASYKWFEEKPVEAKKPISQMKEEITEFDIEQIHKEWLDQLPSLTQRNFLQWFKSQGYKAIK